MTTLTPEKEAELREILQRLHNNKISASSAFGQVFLFISTERQAREAAENLLADRSTELDWERSARQAAEKEVERLTKATAEQERIIGDYQPRAVRAEAKIAALVDVVQKCKRQFEFYTEQHMAKTPPDTAKGAVNEQFADLCHNALSALPPPVPAEEAEAAYVMVPRAPRREEFDKLARLWGYDDEETAETLGVILDVFEAVPTQDPQDVAGLVEGGEDAGRELYGSGYHDGFLDGFLIGKGEDSYPDAEGEREISMQADSENIADGWAAARVPFLSALRTSPIGHEEG